MKLKTRVNISFFIIILLPLLMMTASFFGFIILFRHQIEHVGYPIANPPEELRQLAFYVIVMIVMVLFITGLILSIWLYKSVTEPLRKLGTATQKIKEGELDFEVTEEGPEEIRELCRDFEEMRVRLKEASESQVAYDRESKELISNISHDLRTPIAAVKGYVEGIMDGVADTPEKMDHYLRTIYNKANEMDRLINELTFYSKIDTNRMPYAFAKVGVRGFFDDAAEDMELELDGENVAFSYENKVDPSVQIIADAEQIRRVINNIISNSLKYMDKPERKMSMTVSDSGDFVQVAIKDNGQGIPKKDLEYIFNRFYRADASRNSAQGGSGIGLSIVKKIIEDHGGRVYAQSIEGEETTMFFELRKYMETPAEL
ncbi:MAG: HAMP domain-containing histidine kinase, partial [Lachnospiraceae bacterium]|nr:HAMP domain-containing histidine kinase [Lachnospiraceae bacterium]